MKLKLHKLSPLAIIPKYATPGAACFDLHAINIPEAGVVVSQSAPVIIETGLAFEITPGWCVEIHSRSGHGFKNDLRLSNCTGIIDADYRGEVLVKLAADGAPFVVKNGDRICQAKLVACPQVEFEVVDELSQTERGQGGFGSTDVTAK